jgi:hypothetical protein
MRDKILNIIKEKPKHYSLIIKKSSDMSAWVSNNTLVESTHYPTVIYSALNSESNICKYGNKKTLNRISEGWVCCGPANKCRCTKENISAGVISTKSKTTKEENDIINKKREDTMIQRFGVPFSMQRDSVRKTLSKSKLTPENEILLNDEKWLHKEYIDKQKSLTEIAQDLNVYYGTVGEYCRKHNFTIRQRTQYSIQEKEICAFLDSIDISYIHSDWEMLKSKELDIYIPDYRLGIELNGLYWHSHNPYCPHTPKIEDKNKHKYKTDLAIKTGINLIQITDFEWANKTDIIKSIIKTKVGISTKVYARKLVLKQVDKEEEKSFLNRNHLQGYIASSYAVGLYFNNELCMLMSIGKSRFSKIADIELLRVCTRLDYIVVGGAHKLFNAIKNIFNNKIIVSYCDMSKFTGALYKTLGFTLSRNIAPGFYWTDGNYPISRHKSQTAQLQKWLKTYDSTKSQAENMFLAGYRRYWDCGQSTWILNII